MHSRLRSRNSVKILAKPCYSLPIAFSALLGVLASEVGRRVGRRRAPAGPAAAAGGILCRKPGLGSVRRGVRQLSSSGRGRSRSADSRTDVSLRSRDQLRSVYFGYRSLSLQTSTFSGSLPLPYPSALSAFGWLSVFSPRRLRACNAIVIVLHSCKSLPVFPFVPSRASWSISIKL